MTQIAIIGGGNMGYALAVGLINCDAAYTITVADPLQSQLRRFDSLAVRTTQDNRVAVQSADVVVLAVKPQVIAAVLPVLHHLPQNALVVSIAAGTTLTYLNAQLPPNTPCIRAMPNTPALIGQGMTGLISNEHVSPAHSKQAESIFAVCGEVLWFKDDNELDIVTAVSGSGPAYFFYLIEHVAVAAQRLGLSAESALQLAKQTALGASMMANEEDADPAELRVNVTSPGGTTEAAVNFFEANAVSKLIERAVAKAYHRAVELGKDET